MSHNREIQEGAFVVADAHYSHFRPQFLDFLKKIHARKLKPTQLILMGDIFDTLFGGVTYSIDVNAEAIQLLNEISAEIEVFYLEGNHDFNLKKIFPNVNVFPIAKQPVACWGGGKKIYLAHGDLEGDIGYKIYTAVIRNRFVLAFLRVLNFLSLNQMIQKLDEYLSKKEDCREFHGFETFIAKRLGGKYKCEYFIEGHFHQNKTFKLDDFTYTNLGAFACNQRYFIVKYFKEQLLLEEKMFYKDR